MKSELKYYIRSNFTLLAKVYWNLRASMHNFGFMLKCRFRKIKATDTFFFVIVPNRRHPGLADRLKAIIAAYNQAKMNHLNFKIIYKVPFALEDYLEPSKVNWIADYADLEYSLGSTKFVNEKNGWYLHALPGKQYHCYNYKGDILPEIFEDSGFKWHELFSELFVPSHEVLDAVAKTGLRKKSYNAIHLRFVNALENFEDGYCNGLKTEAEKQNLIIRCRGGVKEVLEKSNNDGIDKVVVFSDSKRFLDSLSDMPVIVLDSKSLGHISFTHDHDKIIKTFLDFFVMADAKTVYRIGANEMYLSSCFSLCAARAGNAEFIDIMV